jgi:hypothetical protein
MKCISYHLNITQLNIDILYDTLNCILMDGSQLFSTIQLSIFRIVDIIYPPVNTNYEGVLTSVLHILPKYYELIMILGLILCLCLLLNVEYSVSKCNMCKRKPRYIVNRKFKLCGNHLHSFLKKNKNNTHCLDTHGDQYYSETNGLRLSKKIKLNYTLN